MAAVLLFVCFNLSKNVVIVTMHWPKNNDFLDARLTGLFTTRITFCTMQNKNQNHPGETTVDVEQLILKYNKPVPRYTSYPTAPHFHKGISSATYATWLAGLPADVPVSVYIHIPFCKTLCWYCGCNTRITSNSSVMRDYCAAVIKEIAMVRAAVGKRLKVSHFQWGGGTPSYIHADDFLAISQAVQHHFQLLENAEVSVEIDPRVLQDDMVAAMAKTGVNRVSFGVQDFNPKVQEAINRVQPFTTTQDAVTRLRQAGITQINLDLMYGLPYQTADSITETVQLAARLNPDRLALFGYAHVPWLKKHQTLLEQHHLPTQEERLAQFTTATQALAQAGFHAIGIDHFAKETDPLWQAKQSGTLRRNFQGYTTDTADSLIGLGCSAISCLPGGYMQNNTSSKAYSLLVNEGVFPTGKGIATSVEDVFRRDVIMTLMCHYRVDVATLAAKHGISRPNYQQMIHTATTKMRPFIEDGLVHTSPSGTLNLATGNHALARLVASCFDTYFADDGQKHAQAV